MFHEIVFDCQVAELTTRTDCAEQDLKEMRQTLQQTCDEVNTNLTELTADRESIQEELNKYVLYFKLT